MSFIEILLVSVSLALDAAIVAVGAGVLGRMRAGAALMIAACFALFQAVMPLLGLFLGFAFKDYLFAYGHIIGFVLLVLVGGKMLHEAFQKEDVGAERDIMRLPTLLLLSIATSIDAFVVGITFNFVEVNVTLAVVTIAIVTFLMALGGVYLGLKGKHLLGNRIEIAGALVLIALGFKVLLWA